MEQQGTKARRTVSNHTDVGHVTGGPTEDSGCQSGGSFYRESGEAALPMAEMAHSLVWAGDETEVVSELQSGSEAAFDAFIAHYHVPVFNLLLQMLVNEADAA